MLKTIVIPSNKSNKREKGERPYRTRRQTDIFRRTDMGSGLGPLGSERRSVAACGRVGVYLQGRLEASEFIEASAQLRYRRMSTGQTLCNELSFPRSRAGWPRIYIYVYEKKKDMIAK